LNVVFVVIVERDKTVAES